MCPSFLKTILKYTNYKEKGVSSWCNGLRNCSKRVRTPVALLCSLSGKYPWERYEPPYPPSYGLNSTTTVLIGEWLWQILLERYEPPYPPSYGLNSTTTVLLGEWFWQIPLGKV